jgi:hypothetical protein
VRSARDGKLALAQELRTSGASAAAALRADGVAKAAGDERPGPAQLAAGGPRAAGNEGEYELLLEMIREGSLLHYGSSGVLDDQDPDLALLLGDQLYAMGLSRLADLGDLEAVAELADLISLLAQARADPAADSADELVAAIWDAGAAAIGWGTSSEHEEAKELARRRERGAPRALGQAASRGGS